MGVVAVSSMAVRVDVDGRAFLDLEGLGHPRYHGMANTDDRRLS